MGEAKIEEAFEQLLLKDLKACSHIQLGEAKLGQLRGHFELLSKWNRTHNLISGLALEDLVPNHYMDSIQAMDLCESQKLLKGTSYDLGAGNGFPGVVAAILYPQRQFVLVESVRKKCSFLRTVKSELKLANLSVRQERVEDLRELQSAFSRAAFSEEHINNLGESFALKGRLVLLRGPAPSAGFEAHLRSGPWQIVQEFFYRLATGSERSLVVLEKSPGST